MAAMKQWATSSNTNISFGEDMGVGFYWHSKQILWILDIIYWHKPQILISGLPPCLRTLHPSAFSSRLSENMDVQKLKTRRVK